MKRQHIVGLGLLAVGITVLVVGLRLSPVTAEHEQTTLWVRLGQPATWILLGGIGAGVLGSVMLLVRVGKLNY